jgi:transcriptional antiterminator RfaH
MSGYWTVVQTETQREHFVRMMLMREGYHTYMPRIRIKKRVVPLFPSYIFAIVIDRWYPIKNTIGVTKVLLAGEEPARIPDKIIAAIKGMEVGGVVRLPKPEKLLKPGAKVQIVRGSFQGSIGIYDGASGKERERVLLDLLGQSVPVNVPAADVRPLRVVP